MKRVGFFNKQLPVMQDLLQVELDGAASIKERSTDEHGWGIIPSNAYSANMVLPVSSLNAAPNLPYVNKEFPLTVDFQAGVFSVGAGSGNGVPSAIGGIAENLLGERIAILLDEVYNSACTSAYGVASSGNLDIPIPGRGIIDSYVWIEYLETNDSTQRVDEDGNPQYPYINDGYKILVTSTAVAPNGDGISIFVGKIHRNSATTWTSLFQTPHYPEILTVTRGTVASSIASGNYVTTVAPEITRVYRAVRDNGVEIFVDSNTTLLPSGYSYGYRGTLRDHILAIGSGIPTPKNPHGITIADLPGGLLEPKVIQDQAESMADGMVDLNIPQNSPVSKSNILLSTIPYPNSGLTSASILDIQAVALGVTPGNYDMWLRIKDLFQNVGNGDKVKAVYLQGHRIVKLYPTVRETQTLLGDVSIIASDTSKNSGDGWVGFNFSDATGTYRIQGAYASIDNGDGTGAKECLIVHKTGPYTYPLPDVAPGILEIATVYWSSANLYRDYTQSNLLDINQNIPVDRRSAGLVGPQQISSVAKNDPDLGILSQVVPQNIVANPSFLFTKGNNDFDGWTILSGTLTSAISGWSQITPTSNADLMSGGPAALTGLQIAVLSTNGGNAEAFGQLGYLKPNKNYAISFDYKIPGTGWSTRFRAGISSSVSAGGSSVLTTGSPAGMPLDLLMKNDGIWHRASMIVETNSGINDGTFSAGVITQALYYLHLRLDAPASASIAGNLLITNVCVTEGEFITGFIPGRYIPSGFSIFSDELSSCPPGFTENTRLRGRIPLGYVFGGLNGVGTYGTPSVASQPGNPIANGSAQTGNETVHHTHAVNAPGTSFDTNNATSTNITGIESAQHQHNLGLDVGIWCKAL